MLRDGKFDIRLLILPKFSVISASIRFCVRSLLRHNTFIESSSASTNPYFCTYSHKAPLITRSLSILKSGKVSQLPCRIKRTRVPTNQGKTIFHRSTDTPSITISSHQNNRLRCISDTSRFCAALPPYTPAEYRSLSILHQHRFHVSSISFHITFQSYHPNS